MVCHGVEPDRNRLGQGLIAPADAMQEIAGEARYLGDRLARLCALARVSVCPDPDGVSITDLDVVADALSGWAQQLGAPAATGRPSGASKDAGDV